MNVLDDQPQAVLDSARLLTSWMSQYPQISQGGSPDLPPDLAMVSSEVCRSDQS
jgi:hypothetical protein